MTVAHARHFVTHVDILPVVSRLRARQRPHPCELRSALDGPSAAFLDARSVRGSSRRRMLPYLRRRSSSNRHRRLDAARATRPQPRSQDLDVDLNRHDHSALADGQRPCGPGLAALLGGVGDVGVDVRAFEEPAVETDETGDGVPGVSLSHTFQASGSLRAPDKLVPLAWPEKLATGRVSLMPCVGTETVTSMYLPTCSVRNRKVCS